jgi:predicted hydrocarbon binding protein
MENTHELTRSGFLKCCASGACSLIAIASAPASALAETNNPDADRWKGQLDQARVRFAAMVSVLDKTLDEPTKKQVFGSVGRECARQFSQDTWEKYKGNFPAFLNDMQGPNGWVAKVDYDEKRGILTITDRPRKCSCPLVKQGSTSATQCLCTLGWQEETYSRLLGKPVEASIVKSILRGDDSCVYRIRILA